MAAKVRPFFRGKSFSKSKDQRVDIDIPLPRDDRPARDGRALSQSPSSSKDSAARPAEVSPMNASSFVRSVQSREHSKASAVHEPPLLENVVFDVSKISETEVFNSITSDGMSPSSGNLRDSSGGHNASQSHASGENAPTSPTSPTSREVGLRGGAKPKFNQLSSLTFDDSIGDERPAAKPTKPQVLDAELEPDDLPEYPLMRDEVVQVRALATWPLSHSKTSTNLQSKEQRQQALWGGGEGGDEERAQAEANLLADTGMINASHAVSMGTVLVSDLIEVLTGPATVTECTFETAETEGVDYVRSHVSRRAEMISGLAATMSQLSNVRTTCGLVRPSLRSSPKGDGGGGRARRLSLIPAGQLQRQLSFADESLDELVSHIRAEEPQLDWLDARRKEDFWNRVLVGTPPTECRNLSTRSIGYWIGLFNRWQAMGSWKPGSAPKFLDAYELQELLSVAMPKALEWVKLFDPPAYAQLQTTRSAMDHKKVKVLVPAFLTCGIFLSTTISKRQKIRFLLGMFDENDSQTFESSEFVEMISSFFYGIACAFALLDFPGVAPKPSARQKLGKHLFERVLKGACCRVPFWEAKKMKAEDSAPLWLIEEWFLGETGDPLSAPFAMLLERFSTRGLEDDPEFFEDEERRFKLSHTSPVEPPLETAASLDSSFLRRGEIGLVRKVYDECERQRDFSLSHADVGRALGELIPPDLWCNRIARGLDEMERVRGMGQKTSLPLFLKKICPNAKPRHLRMFQTWMKELDHIEELKVQSATSRRMQQHFESYVARPILPARVRQELLQEFESLAYASSEARVMQDALRKKFFDGGSRVTKEDYLAAMCPTDFRHKEGNPAINQVVGMQVVKVEEALSQKEALFANSGEVPITRRKFIKHSVPDNHWALWNQAFEAFENGTGKGQVSMSELVRQNDLCPVVCEFICNIITGSCDGSEPCFSKEQWLRRLLELSSWRVKKEVLSQGRLCAV
ncbi:unnamed protein product [Symbiodinium sp. CCMP2456]|nr:unnamed protein product [Symbiodinium sp. CCMP2456]